MTDDVFKKVLDMLEQGESEAVKKSKKKKSSTETIGSYPIGNPDVYVKTCPLIRGDLILPADQLISNSLAWIDNFILAAKSVILKNCAKYD